MKDNELFRQIERTLYRDGMLINTAGTILGLSGNDKAKLSFFAQSVPFFGEVINTKNNWNRTNDYLKNTGMKWSDIKYGGFGGSSLHGTVNFVSSNIKQLYR